MTRLRRPALCPLSYGDLAPPEGLEPPPSRLEGGFPSCRVGGMEAQAGLEPADTCFADRPLSRLGTAPLGAGSENRTRVARLEAWCLTIRPYPQKY